MSQRSSRPESPPKIRRKTAQGWVIGKIGGVPVLLAPSWFLIAIILAVFFYPNVAAYEPDVTMTVAAMVSVAFAILLCLSVFVHELAHGQVARALGVPVRAYVINLWGGHTQFDSAVKSPGASALISIVGPLANAVIAIFGFAATSLLAMPRIVLLLVLALAAANAFVAIFNALPGLPLDGGRVLESLIWAISGNRYTGTMTAARVGRVVGVLTVLGFLLVPVVQNGEPNFTGVIWSGLIGWYLWTGATQSIRQARASRAVASLSAIRLAHPATMISAEASVAQAEFATGRTGTDFAVIVSVHGRPTGYLDPIAAGSVPVELRDRTPAASAAIPIPDGAFLSENLTGEEFLGVARQIASISTVAVVVTEAVIPQVRGLLWLKDVAAALDPSKDSGQFRE